ncbi:MAG: SpoIIE family protein phosphatase [Bacteroidetes bacterium]|nr:SpoIIE family protein phosphatase [Bacteroidota bacterium]
MKNKLLSITIVLIAQYLAFNSPIYAQENFVFENFSIPQGLSNPNINCIYEDKFGFLWLGTNDGLNRYDGYEFKVYKNNPSDSTSLPGNTITAINEDKNGNLWIGGFNVMVKYIREKDNFEKVNFNKGNNLNLPNIDNLFIDSKNRIWLGTDSFGLHLLNSEKMSTRKIEFMVNNEKIFNGDIFSINETNNHEILALDYGLGIFYYNEEKDVFLQYKNLGTDILGSGMFVIHEDEFNRIWIGGENALLIYNKNTSNVESVPMFSHAGKFGFFTRGVYKILKDKTGFLWIATLDDGLFRYNPVDNNFFRFSYTADSKNNIKSTGILSLYQDSFGNIWIGTMLDGLYKVDPNKQPMNVIRIPENLKTNSPKDKITAVAKTENDNNLIFGTAGIGLIIQNPQTKALLNYKSGTSASSLSSNNISSLTVDENNNIWIGSDKGLDYLNRKSGTITSYFKDAINKYVRFSIRDLKIDYAGRLFVASSQGVDIFYPKQDFLKKIPSLINRELSPELKSDLIRIADTSKPLAAILKVGEQKLLNTKFEIKDSTKVLILGVGEGQPNLETMFDYGWLEDEAGNLVWGMQKFVNSFHFDGGMKNRIIAQTLSLKKGIYNLKFQSDVGHSYGNFNVESPKDSALWGIQVLKINDEQEKDFSERINSEIKNSSKMLMENATSIYISKFYEDILWIGTISQGLIKYNLGNGKFTQYNKNIKVVKEIVTNNDVYNVLEDSKGIVWFSSPIGLGKLNPKTEKIIFYTEKDGLPTNLVLAIQEDNYGNLWISSAAGLTTLVRSEEGEKESFINIDIKDGLQGYSYSTATWKTDIGELFFGGDNGINYFVPGRTNQTKPKIVITDLRISDVSVFNNNSTSPLSKDLNETEELTLSYSQNDIAFQFAPIHYSRPERNLIAYKLDGFNADWVYSKLKFATFTNLDPGEYTLKLKAANGDGIWSDEERTIRIVILPPYWRTTLAYISYGIIFFGIIFGIDRIQRRRILTKERNVAAIKEAELRAMAAEAQSRVMQAENERKSKELEEARELQLSMLPKNLPSLPHLDIAVYMKTATEVGGDYYDFNVGLDGTLTVVIGDATGHGMKAGTMVTAAKTLFNSYSANPNILFTFHEMTRCIKQLQMQSVSMCLTMLKIRNNNLIISSAGMPPMFLFKRESRIVEEHLLKGMPLGTMNNFPYEIREMELAKGDTILLMSDGFPELTNEDNELYGYKRVRNKFEETADKEPEEIITCLKDEGSRWVKDNDPDDDVTFVVIKIK